MLGRFLEQLHPALCLLVVEQVQHLVMAQREEQLDARLQYTEAACAEQSATNTQSRPALCASSARVRAASPCLGSFGMLPTEQVCYLQVLTLH
jgi:hypothetical protein